MTEPLVNVRTFCYDNDARLHHDYRFPVGEGGYEASACMILAFTMQQVFAACKLAIALTMCAGSHSDRDPSFPLSQRPLVHRRPSELIL